jgi:hypothetical protein
MKADSPIVEEVRRRRMEISARFDHDLEKYMAHLRDIERAMRRARREPAHNHPAIELRRVINS